MRFLWTIAVAGGCVEAPAEDTNDDGTSGTPTVPDTDTDTDVIVDGDGDGFEALDAGGDDCDDTDPEVNPGADERCGGVDENCDGTTDAGAVDASDWHLDADGDGYGADDDAVSSCDEVDGRIPVGGDCADSDPAIHPGVAELCNGLDDDCDSNTAEVAQIGDEGYDTVGAALAAAAPGAAIELCDGTISEFQLVVSQAVTMPPGAGRRTSDARPSCGR